MIITITEFFLAAIVAITLIPALLDFRPCLQGGRVTLALGLP